MHTHKTLYATLILLVFYASPSIAPAATHTAAHTARPTRSSAPLEMGRSESNSMIQPSVQPTQIAVATEAQITMVTGTTPVEPQVETAIRESLIHARNFGAVPVVNYAAVSAPPSTIGEWTFVSVVAFVELDIDQSWQLDNASWFGLVLLHQDENGQLSGAAQGTPEFSSLLAQVPTQAFTTKAKQHIDPLQRSLTSTMSSSRYRFPWQSGTQMQYGPKGVHSADYASYFNIPGWKTVDFLSDGDTAAGHAPNRLLAAASGAISGVCNDGTTVAVKIDNSLIYAHLLNNSNLTMGHYFNRGDEMGQLKSGSFSASCGNADQGTNWFHVHWGFPDTGSFQVEDWTLSLSDGLWRRGSETRGINSWFQAGASNSNSCPPPTLNSPSDGDTESSRTVNFSWQAPSGCTFSGYTFRVKDTSNMDSGGTTIVDTGESGTSHQEMINGRDDQDLYWGVRAANAPNGASWATHRFRIHVASACPGPSLNNPQDGRTLPSRTVTFDWQGLSGCAFSGYTFRVKTVPDMESGGTQIIDTGDSNTSWTATFNPQWDNQDLYWGVRAANASAGAGWSVRRFRISPDSQPPAVTWTTPTGNEQTYHVASGLVQLQVNATDNVAVDHVSFNRWDAPNSRPVDVGTVSSPPYQVTIDASTLNYAWNQVNATAYDTSGNSATHFIWLYRDQPTVTPTGTPTNTPTATATASPPTGGYQMNVPATQGDSVIDVGTRIKMQAH